jgi:lipopolysaccharide export system protein LptC
MSSRTEQSVHDARAKRAVVRSSFIQLIGVAAGLGVVGLVGFFVWQTSVLAPPSPQDVKTQDVVAKPDQITAQNAGISGRDKNNRPFQIKAKSGEQDKLTESLVHMQQVEGAFERPSGGKLDITSASGKFDTKTRQLELNGHVVFQENQRFKATMDKAFVDTNDQSLTSGAPVKVDMQGTLIEANSLTVTQNGSRILFKGGVKARFESKSK